MEEFTQLFGSLLAFVYHCFDRIVIHGYLSGLSRPEPVVYFFRQVLDRPVVSKEVLSQRTRDYQDWVEAYARNHHIPIEWAEKGVRKEDYVSPRLRRLVKKNDYGVYFIFKSMEQGRTFRISVPKYPTQDPNYRILAHQRIRFTHYYFYVRDEGCCAWPPSFPFTPPTGSTAIPSSSKNCSEPTSASTKTTTPFSPSTTWPPCRQRPT